MVEINLWAGLRPYADGQTKVEVDAQNVRGLLKALAEKYPGLKPVIDAGVSVTIDGTMSSSLSDPVTPQNDLHLMQRLKGG